MTATEIPQSTPGSGSDVAPASGELRPELRCLGGSQAPPELGKGLARLLLLPESARRQFANVLEPHLGIEAADDQVATAVRRFCRDHNVETDAVLPPVQASRMLLRGAARWNVKPEDFIGDLKALFPEELQALMLEHMLPLYEVAFPQLRRLAAIQSVTEHSNLVRSVSWRVDLVKNSAHAIDLDLPLATLTFDYQQGAGTKQISLQLLPDELIALRDTCTQILS